VEHALKIGCSFRVGTAEDEIFFSDGVADLDVEAPALAVASTGLPMPRVSREDRKFFRFISTIELILLRLKITILSVCEVYW
jgi:hypothetical protein